ncbi:MAG: DNA mismatch repair protein MutS [Candidatus Eremiobacteraeota bacterium]|nr:DNA mismatch repair protein MutS [Candidatus Eremiobacteraeota bacterium]MBC5827019.1 DNA mismatch repair protein MutS [Candidatus Eremiobacteraeota bacterium]
MRVGDFYEAYGDEAQDLARSLDIALTSKEAGKGRRVAMAGVPHHSLDQYLAKLMRQRRVVAIAEQMEAPVPNRLVRRQVIRLLTPGTVLEEQFLDPGRNNYLCAVAPAAGKIAIASADVSTVAAAVTVMPDDDELGAELERLAPSEIVVEDEEIANRCRPMVNDACRIAVEEVDDDAAPLRLPALSLAIEDQPAAKAALRLLYAYLKRMRLDAAAIIARSQVHDARRAMMLDSATRRHLDLLAGAGDNSRASLLSVLFKTKTAMGGRMLARRLCAPLVDVQAIRERHDRVEALVERLSFRQNVQEGLAKIGDIERLLAKVRARRALPRDLAALRDSLTEVAALRDTIGRAHDCEDPMGWGGFVPLLACETTIAAMRDALLDEPSPTLSEGGVIRPQKRQELADVFSLRTESRRHLLALEEATRVRCGIRSLKIRYTQAFGYYFEVPRSQADGVPSDFIRRQTLTNAERYTNPELKRLEADLLTAKARQVALERDEFEALLQIIDGNQAALLAAADAVAQMDVDCALAQVAGERDYVRPRMVEESRLDIVDGRHPIVEAYGGVDFVPNNIALDDDGRFLLLTGPNMGGKSTYLRQAALLCVLAQTGSFIPAARATMGIVDRLFTRIGAGDDIASGRSTFYVEMAGMALILRRCTPRSLLLIDEVGRGTGTTDGLSIAQALSEFLLQLEAAMPMVLFATHFHELVLLASTYPRLRNMHVVVADGPGGPVFSHRLMHGASSRSYGIAVGKMAGLPLAVVRRAQEIADELESRPAPAAGPARRPGEVDSRQTAQLDLLT